MNEIPGEPDDQENRADQLRHRFACAIWAFIIEHENQGLDRASERDVLEFIAALPDERWWTAMALVDAND